MGGIKGIGLAFAFKGTYRTSNISLITMFISGHLSLAYLLHRWSGMGLAVLTAAALFPDLVDKGLKFVGFFATGRHTAHNLFALLITSALVLGVKGIGEGSAWFVGYAAHLLGDLPFSWDMPWFFPLEWGRWENSVDSYFLGLSVGQLLLDLFIMGLAGSLFVVAWYKKRGTGIRVVARGGGWRKWIEKQAEEWL